MPTSSPAMHLICQFVAFITSAGFKYLRQAHMLARILLKKVKQFIHKAARHYQSNYVCRQGYCWVGECRTGAA